MKKNRGVEWSLKKSIDEDILRRNIKEYVTFFGTEEFELLLNKTFKIMEVKNERLS